MTQDRSVRRAFTTALLIGAVLLLVIAVALQHAVRESRASAAWISHTHQVLETAADLQASALLFDASQRAVLVTASDFFRNARAEALNDLRSGATDLAGLTADNRPQQERAQLLLVQVNERAELALRNEEAVASGRLTARAAIADPDSLLAIQRVQETLNLIKAEERELLRERQTRQDEFQRRTLWIVASFIGAGGLLLLWTGRGYFREAGRRASTESNYRDLVQALPVGVWRLKHDATEGLRFEFVSDNAPAVRQVDVLSATQEYDNVFRTIYPEDRPRVQQAMEHTLQTLEPLDVEYRVGKIDSARWIHSSARARRDADGSVVLSGYWADVTRERVLREAITAARDEATRATQAKSAFLAAMSHEIRTPMNGVLGLLELLSLSSLDAEQRSTLAVVRSSAQSLLRIVDDILDFSKMEADRLTLHCVPSSLQRLVQSTCQIYSSHASGKGLLLQCTIDPDISPVLQFDHQRLAQILNNLVSNALKFTERGSVTLRAERVGAEDGWERVCLTVADTGIGVSEEDMERLFQPFEQSSRDTSARYGGTGLGLVISRRLAELMGGTLTMESAPGCGTTMTLVCRFQVCAPTALPLDPAEGAQKELETMVHRSRTPPGVRQAQEEGTLVLVVDDHPTNRMVLKRQLMSLGYAAEAASDGLKGLEGWQSGRYALVIADCNMPAMTGHEMARAIRTHEQEHGLARTPIFACTANAMAGEAEACQEAGMDEYMVKPIGMAELGRQLARWLPLPQHRVADGADGHETDAAASAIDLQLLQALTGGDAAAEVDLIDEYARTHEADARTLRDALASADLEGALRMAHRIRGSCVTLGSVALARATSNLEDALRSETPGAFAAALDTFEEELGRLLQLLAPLRRGIAAATHPAP